MGKHVMICPGQLVKPNFDQLSRCFTWDKLPFVKDGCISKCGTLIELDRDFTGIVVSVIKGVDASDKPASIVTFLLDMRLLSSWERGVAAL